MQISVRYLNSRFSKILHYFSFSLSGLVGLWSSYRLRVLDYILLNFYPFILFINNKIFIIYIYCVILRLLCDWTSIFWLRKPKIWNLIFLQYSLSIWNNHGLKFISIILNIILCDYYLTRIYSTNLFIVYSTLT